MSKFLTDKTNINGRLLAEAKILNLSDVTGTACLLLSVLAAIAACCFYIADDLLLACSTAVIHACLFSATSISAALIEKAAIELMSFLADERMDAIFVGMIAFWLFALVAFTLANCCTTYLMENRIIWSIGFQLFICFIGPAVLFLINLFLRFRQTYL